MEFGMDFSYDCGNAADWYGDPDLAPMYAAYEKMAPYCYQHGFRWANTHGLQIGNVTAEILVNTLTILAGAGLKLNVWLCANCEAGWAIGDRVMDPIYTHFQDMIEAIDAVPDVARMVQQITYAPEIDQDGTAVEITDYLAWAEPIFRGWLAASTNLKTVQLLGGLAGQALPTDAANLTAIRPYVDLCSLSMYSMTDAIFNQKLAAWLSYDSSIRTPLAITEMNNSSRNLCGPYNAANHYGYVPSKWLTSWEDAGATAIFLHRGNCDGCGSYAWFDEYGYPLPWLSAYLADDIRHWGNRRATRLHLVAAQEEEE